MRGRRAAASLASLLAFMAGCRPFDVSTQGGAADAGLPDARPVDASTDAMDASDSATAAMCPNGALQFEEESYVEVASDASLDATDALTVEAWIKPSTSINDDEVHIVSHHDHDTSDGYVLMLYGGLKLRVYAGEGGGKLDEVVAPISLGVWHHVAAVFDGTGAELRLYVDGTLANTKENVTAKIDAYDGPLRLGRAAYMNAFEYEGVIDEVRVSRSVRFKASFTPVYPLPDDEVDTIATWHFAEQKGTTATDASHGLSATLTAGGIENLPTWVLSECPTP